MLLDSSYISPMIHGTPRSADSGETGSSRVGIHQPVLLHETIEALRIEPDGCYFDCTFGAGGHGRAILERLGPRGRLFAFDKDLDAVRRARSLFEGDRRFRIEHGSYRRLGEVAADERLCGRVHGVLFDLGVSSDQLEDPARGFSFARDGALDMRMDVSRGVTAAEWLARASRKEIARVLSDYGEERHANRIARAIERTRRESPIRTTARLSALISGCLPHKPGARHAATRSFQAIRIHVNGELEDLNAALPQVPILLGPGGRLLTIVFHGLETRIVRSFLRGGSEPAFRGLPAKRPALRRVGRTVRPGPHERAMNPRCRSAALIVAEQLGAC